MKEEYAIKFTVTTFDGEELNLKLTGEADYCYHSSSCEPSNWVLCTAVDTNTNIEYECWYYVDDDTELEDVDYYEPYEVTTENGTRVYLKEQ